MSAGQYIRRAAGYFIKLVVLVGLLYLLMFVTGTARVSAEFFFRELFTTPRGILLVAALAVLSAFYPKFGTSAAKRRPTSWPTGMPSSMRSMRRAT